MKRIISTDIVNISEEILNSNFVLVGELHGVKQNVQVIKSMVELVIKNGKSVLLAFEWPLTEVEVKNINDYITSSTDSFPMSPFFVDSDGRFSIGHVMLFKYLRENNNTSNVSIHCFDSLGFSENYEEEMAQKLLELKQNDNTVIIAETGVMHARRRKYFDSNERAQVPMGFYVSEKYKTLSIFLRYLSGSVMVEGVLHSVCNASSQIEGPDDSFDVELVINNAEPALEIEKLTEIRALIES